MLKNKDIISVRDMRKEDIELVLEKAEETERTGKSGIMKGKILASLFFEPSTRTRLSFSSAMHSLGGNVIGFESTEGTSVAKGENLADTIRMANGYSDLIVIRHPKEGAARFAAELSEKPVINAGDGANQHPTQTLLDLYSIKKFAGAIEGTNVTLLGDLKYGRVMKSLFYALSMFGANIHLSSPKGLEMPQSIVEEARQKFGADIMQSNEILEGIKGADVVYACRIQKERFADPYEAEKMQREFRLTLEILEKGKDDVIILHALPKVTEIEPSIDNTRHAKYFEQAALGVPVRMALISLLVG
ncbi:MAG: aspartate carbamoyltransferase [Candidatus Aenigmarchaeota archaeon]|nr:aspartate carbamoyltransferase [Candidatus Aenigmarchaeota archaeon]